MSIGDFFGRARESFAPQPPVESVGVPHVQQPINIVMAGAAKRNIPTPVLLVGGCIVVLALYLAGHGTAKKETAQHGPEPTLPTTASIKGWNQTSTLAPTPERTAAQQAEADYEAKLRADSPAMAQQRANDLYGRPTEPTGGGNTGQQALTPAQQATEDRRKADEISLAASSVIAIPDAPVPQTAIAAKAERETDDPPSRTAAAPVKVAEDKTRRDCGDHFVDGGVTKYAICEGTVITAISEFRLVGEFAGPVKAEIFNDVYSMDKQHLLIPRGTIALGDAERVGAANQKRMKVSFHRLLRSDGKGFVLEKMIALDQGGETALSGHLNRHLVSTFGTAAAIGALGALSGLGGGGYYGGNGLDAFRGGVSQQMGQAGQTVLQNGLNRPPEITIDPGKILNIYISEDLMIPEFMQPTQVSERTQLKRRNP